MTTNSRIIQSGSHIRMHLAIQLSDGTEALSTFAEEPLDFTLGDGTLTPGTEALLLGQGAGVPQERLVSGNDLFEVWQEAKLHWLTAADFPQGVPAVGSLVAFAGPAGEEIAAIVKEIQGPRLLIDFNHPLSGRLLRLRYHILEVIGPDPGRGGDVGL
ncbi:MAG: peptidylprolyl isomerase [Gammaproteobacteria bacterium]|jgi:FKBP-type peptidyl-prolyl cis-trans isomerase SlpA|nr:peptidylprolyl isomerase [Gammaproteobacteria bacterium]